MFEILFYMVLGFIALLTIVVELHKWHVNLQIPNFFPGFDFPLIGIPAYFIGKKIGDITEIINQVFDQPESVTAGRAWAGSQLLVTVTDPENLKFLLTSDDCLDKPYIYQQFDSKKGILSSDPQQWKHDRRHLAPTLSMKMVAKFVPIFDAKARKSIEIMGREPGDINYHRSIVKCLLDMHFAALFGSDQDIQSPVGDELYECLVTTMEHYQSRLLRPWLMFDAIYCLTKSYAVKQEAYLKLFNFINNVAANKSREMNERFAGASDESNASSSNLNTLEKCFQMMRDGKMSESTLNDHAYIITAAAVDSTASALYSILILLAIYPEYQEKLVDELHEIFPSADAPVTLDDCVRMEYCEMVIKESMRILPPAPVMGRLTSTEVKIGTDIIPKGTIIMFNMNKVHRLQSNWGSRSNEFDPEHFSAENMKHQHPYTFLGFSGGQRNCIGAKYAMVAMKVMLAYFLRNYTFSSDLKVADIKTELSIVAKIKNEKPFRCVPRVF